MQKQTKTETVTQALKNRIQAGIYPYGTALPAERDLAGNFGLNRSTVRAAIQALVDEGLLKRFRVRVRLLCAIQRMINIHISAV